MAMIPTSTLDALQQCWTSLSALGAALGEEEWNRPTDLPGWSVKDNLSHLIAIERMLEGLPGTQHKAEHRDYVRNPIGEHNENEVDARRSLSGAQVLQEWNEICAQRIATFSTAGEDYFAQPAMTPVGPGTLDTVMLNIGGVRPPMPASSTSRPCSPRPSRS